MSTFFRRLSENDQSTKFWKESLFANALKKLVHVHFK